LQIIYKILSWFLREWLKDFDISLNGRKIALILDGASSHCDIELVNITLVFLVANTTSVCQPMDQGIIQCFKMHYRKRIQIEYIKSFDKQMIPSISLKTAIDWLVMAWKEVNMDCISNCFKKAKILPPADNENISEIHPIQDQIDRFANELEYENALIEEWFDFDRYVETDRPARDEDLVEAILIDSGIIEAPFEADESEEVALIKENEGIDALRTSILYLEQNFGKLKITETQLIALKSTLYDKEYSAKLQCIKAKEQKTLLNFYAPLST